MLTGMSRDELLGMGGLLGGVGLFSAVEVASKIIGPRVDPVVLTFLRFFLTGIVLILLSLPLLRLRIVPLGGRDFGIFLLNGLVGVALGITLFHVAIPTMEKAASAACFSRFSGPCSRGAGRGDNDRRCGPLVTEH